MLKPSEPPPLPSLSPTFSELPESPSALSSPSPLSALSGPSAPAGWMSALPTSINEIRQYENMRWDCEVRAISSEPTPTQILCCTPINELYRHIIVFCTSFVTPGPAEVGHTFLVRTLTVHSTHGLRGDVWCSPQGEQRVQERREKGEHAVCSLCTTWVRAWEVAGRVRKFRTNLKWLRKYPELKCIGIPGKCGRDPVTMS